MLDSKVQTPDHSPVAWVKPSTLVTSGIALGNTPLKAEFLALPGICVTLHSQILLAKLSYNVQVW